MALMDEFKEERASIKKENFKTQFLYFWEYYKWYVIGPILAIAFIIYYIYTSVNAKDTAFYAAMLNTTEYNPLINEKLGVEKPTLFDHENDFIKYIDLNEDEYRVMFDTSMRIHDDPEEKETSEGIEKLMTYLGAGEIDILVTGAADFADYAYDSHFYDLREIMTQEQLTKYEPYLYYVDGRIVEEVKVAMDNMDYSYQLVVPDPTNPDAMEDPIPVGIYVHDSEYLLDTLIFEDSKVAMGIYANAPHIETALLYLDFLLDLPYEEAAKLAE